MVRLYHAILGLALFLSTHAFHVELRLELGNHFALKGVRFVLATNDLQDLPLKIFRTFLTNASRDAGVVVVDIGVPAVGQPTLAKRSLVGSASGVGDTDVTLTAR